MTLYTLASWCKTMKVRIKRITTFGTPMAILGLVCVSVTGAPVDAYPNAKPPTSKPVHRAPFKHDHQAHLAKQNVRPAGKPLPVIAFEEIESGDKCAIKLFQTMAIQNKNDWQSVWSRHNLKNASLPDVDFEKNTVLAVFAGQKPSLGYSVKILSVQRKPDGGARVSYKITKPAPGNTAAAAISQPFHIVKADKISGSTSFSPSFN